MTVLIIIGLFVLVGCIGHLVDEHDYKQWARQKDRENEQNEPSDGPVG